MWGFAYLVASYSLEHAVKCFSPYMPIALFEHGPQQKELIIYYYCCQFFVFHVLVSKSPPHLLTVSNLEPDIPLFYIATGTGGHSILNFDHYSTWIYHHFSEALQDAIM